MTQDEPELGPNIQAGPPSVDADDPFLPERIRQLVERERFAVLATQGEGQPYASLIAFALSEDLSAAVFATPKDTRKYRLLMKCDRVALLVDTRSQGATDMMKIEAFTATGTAACLQPGAERERWARLLVRRHPHLESFVASPDTALFRIDVDHYFHVGRFQEVRRWRPHPGG
jgi:nitroimidazol reductase NimA-like FMN-containing flavoprotein (pyridoxamine 5'-phosphate oxidase superfamily)